MNERIIQIVTTLVKKSHNGPAKAQPRAGEERGGEGIDRAGMEEGI